MSLVFLRDVWEASSPEIGSLKLLNQFQETSKFTFGSERRVTLFADVLRQCIARVINFLTSDNFVLDRGNI